MFLSVGKFPKISVGNFPEVSSIPVFPETSKLIYSNIKFPGKITTLLFSQISIVWHIICFSIYFSFVFCLIFLSVPCGGLSWPQVSFLLHVKYTVSYGIVSSCMGRSVASTLPLDPPLPVLPILWLQDIKLWSRLSTDVIVIRA